MRMQLNQHKNPDYVDSIGIDQAVDMNPKTYISPSPNRSSFVPVGGVSDANGLPVGGVDQDNTQQGQQMMPQQQDQDLQPNPSPQGTPAPEQEGTPQQKMGNMLSMTPQGQTMQALAPNGMANGGKVSPKQMAAIKAKMMKGQTKKYAKGGKVDTPYSETSNPGRVLFRGKGHGQTKGIIVPRHMWEGSEGVYDKGEKKGQPFKNEGMKDLNKARAEVYGAENRAPLTIGQVGRTHKNVLDEHFAKPLKEQLAAEDQALARLRAAKHIGKGANTLDKSEKLDTVKHELDAEGRSHVGFASKGVAGHSLYTSGHGDNMEHHIINTCPGQTVGCGGGHDEHGIIDTMKGTCFAPNAESQYVNASVRRAAHEQAKHDPKMTRDWILAHTGSIRKAAETADKSNVRTLFRPNVVDETDTSSRHVIRHLNKQRKIKDKPPIIANSYGKTNELHDPENGYFVTHSNVGPKVKHGMSIAENIARDKQRVRSTVTATEASGKDFENEEGNKTPPKGSYMVTDVKRKSPMQKEMEKHIKHAKYWSTGRDVNELSKEEKAEGDEGHFDGNGKPTTPEKAHFGHMIFDGKRYDYQKQHILHPRLVNVPERKKNNKTGKMETVEHMIPTDSRFMDEKFLPKNRFKTKNGKLAGHILMTTPTESTSNLGHETTFTHHVGEHNIDYAKRNKGEYEIDSPMHQAMAEGKEYVKPEPIKIVRKVKAVKKAEGGSITFTPHDYDDDFNCFPERNYIAQHHLANRAGVEDETELPESLLQRPKD
jgi:azurin